MRRQRPYCKIGVNYYFLYEAENNVVRFKKISNENNQIDWNSVWLNYYNGNLSLTNLLLKYINTNSSYQLVKDLFSKNNLENITQGTELPFKFRYYPKLNKK